MDLDTVGDAGIAAVMVYWLVILSIFFVLFLAVILCISSSVEHTFDACSTLSIDMLTLCIAQCIPCLLFLGKLSLFLCSTLLLYNVKLPRSYTPVGSCVPSGQAHCGYHYALPTHSGPASLDAVCILVVFAVGVVQFGGVASVDGVGDGVMQVHGHRLA